MTKVPWKDSNLALIGSDLDRKIKAAAADGEQAWEGLGTEPTIKIWRIEQFKVVPWPEEEYGSFHEGDSYIVYKATEKDRGNGLLHDIHIWIGNESSQDEYGTAAYKMVEADESLGGAAVQHREVQGHEGDRFQSYFDALTYKAGGIESGFNRVVATEEAPSLYRIKGTHKGISLTQVPLSRSSLNKGDSFILAANKSKVWLWNGALANPIEKARGIAVAEKMCTLGTVVTLKQDHGDEEASEFWAYLGDGDIQDADDRDEEVEEFAPLLFQLMPGSDPIQVAEGQAVKVGFRQTKNQLPRSALDETNVYLVDAGWELFLWLGKDADRSEKLAAMSIADGYSRSNLRAKDLPLTIVKSGYEPSSFEDFFAD